MTWPPPLHIAYCFRWCRCYASPSLYFVEKNHVLVWGGELVDGKWKQGTRYRYKLILIFEVIWLIDLEKSLLRVARAETEPGIYLLLGWSESVSGDYCGYKWAWHSASLISSDQEFNQWWKSFIFISVSLLPLASITQHRFSATPAL